MLNKFEKINRFISLWRFICCGKFYARNGKPTINLVVNLFYPTCSTANATTNLYLPHHTNSKQQINTTNNILNKEITHPRASLFINKLNSANFFPKSIDINRNLKNEFEPFLLSIFPIF